MPPPEEPGAEEQTAEAEEVVEQTAEAEEVEEPPVDESPPEGDDES